MSVKAVGDGHRLLRDLLKHPDELKQKLLTSAAGEALSLVKRGFREEVAPDGTAWLPLKHRRGMILRKTGRLANSFTSRAVPNGFAVGTNVAYAKYQQDGTRGHKAHTRKQAYSHHQDLDTESGTVKNYYRFTRESGKARVSVSLSEDKVRIVKRSNGKVIRIDTKKLLQTREVAGHRTLNFKEGKGGIPARPMVPPNGKLPPRWVEALDRAVDRTAQRIVNDAGGRWTRK